MFMMAKLRFRFIGLLAMSIGASPFATRYEEIRNIP
jgi:hypothetical protein